MASRVTAMFVEIVQQFVPRARVTAAYIEVVTRERRITPVVHGRRTGMALRRR